MLTDASPEFITIAKGVAAKAGPARPSSGVKNSVRRFIMAPL
jgi:hypothetical protein